MSTSCVMESQPCGTWTLTTWWPVAWIMVLLITIPFTPEMMLATLAMSAPGLSRSKRVVPSSGAVPGLVSEEISNTYVLAAT